MGRNYQVSVQVDSSFLDIDRHIVADDTVLREEMEKLTKRFDQYLLIPKNNKYP